MQGASDAAADLFGYAQAEAQGLTVAGQQPRLASARGGGAGPPNSGQATDSASAPSQTSQPDTPVSAILGGIFAVLVVLCVAAAAAALLIRRRRARGKDTDGRSRRGSDPVDVQSSQSPSVGAFPFSVSSWSTNVQPTPEASSASHVGVGAVNEAEQSLVATVHAMAAAQPPVLLAGRYVLSADMVQGGQGMVVFARGRDNGLRQYAVKCAPACPPLRETGPASAVQRARGRCASSH